MSEDQREANLRTLREADDIQQKTKESVFRIQKQVNETQDLGNLTLEQLRKQGAQMVRNYCKLYRPVYIWLVVTLES